MSEGSVIPSHGSYLLPSGHPIGVLSTLDITGVLAWGEM
jgi:hypothetical protein